MKTERKYSKQVSTNGWMAQFQRWCFGDLTPTFVGYCPFFWFTWLCVFISPLILIGKIVEPVGHGFYVLVRVKERKPRRPSDSKVAKVYQYILNYGMDAARDNIRWDSSYRAVFEWIDATPNWEECAKQILAKEAQREAKEKVRLANRAEFRKKFTKLIGNYGGVVVRPLLFLLALVIAYFLWKLVVALFCAITFKFLIFTAEVFAGVFVACLVFSILFRSILALVTYLRQCPKKEKPERSSFWRPIFDALKIGIDFCVETVAMLYTRECPLIEWSDKSGAIKRRK